MQIGKMKWKLKCSLQVVLLPSWINIWWIWMLIFSINIGPTFEQGTRSQYINVQGVGLRQQQQQSGQQVIVPGGFQDQLFASHFPGQLSNRNSRVVSPAAATSIQNQQFGFFATSGDQLANIQTPSIHTGKPTTGGSGSILQPNFLNLQYNPNAQPIKSNRPHVVSTNKDVQYEYYDEPEEDVIYHQYGSDQGSNGNSIRGNNPTRAGGQQHHTSVTPSKVGSSSTTRGTQLPAVVIRGPKTPAAKAIRNNERTVVYTNLPPSDLTPGQLANKSPSRGFPSNNKPSVSRTPVSGPSRDTSSSSFIPLIEEDDDVEPILALNGRSVHPNLQSRINNLPIRPPSALLRSTAAIQSSEATTPSPTQGSTSKPVTTSRGRTRNNNSIASSSPTAPQRTPSTSVSPTTRRPGILRNNRFTLTARPPIIGRRNSTGKAKEDSVQTSSSTYRPDPILEKKPQQSKEKYVLHPPSGSSPDSADSNSEDYTIEYVEYPVSPEDDKSAFEYYEVSEETAAAILTNRSRIIVPEKKTTEKPKNAPTKVTVSVSSKSSSTTQTTSSTTTPAPFVQSSSEEIGSGSSESKGQVVISVATTKSVSGSKIKEGASVTPSPVTPTPRVTFSRATGSSVVIASVQTSRSVLAGNGPTRPSKVVSTETIRDSVPSSAETSPDYYEENYSYPDNFPVLTSEAGAGIDATGHHSTSTSVSSSSSRDAKTQEPSSAPVLESLSHEGDEEESEGEKEHEEIREDERRPQPRKLPSKHGEVPVGHFETLVDFGDDLGSDQHIPLVQSQDIEENKEVPSSSTTSTTTTTTTTTTATPETSEVVVPVTGIKFAEISPDLLPPGFKFPSTSEEVPSSTTTKTTTTTTTTTTTEKPSTTASTTEAPVIFENLPSFLLPKGYKPLATEATSTTTTTTSTQAPPASSSEGVKFDEIPSAFLPKGYKPFKTPDALSTKAPAVETSTTQKPFDPLAAILSKVQFKEIAIPDLIPKDYKPPVESPSPIGGVKFETPSNLLPPGFKLPESSESGIPPNLLPPGFKPTPSVAAVPVQLANLLPPGYKPPSDSAVEPVVPANLLPPGFKFPGKPSSAPVVPSLASPAVTTKKPGGIIYPTKPGGFRVTRPTTTEGPKANTPPPPRVTIGAGGWPTRKTTEFTGWPTSSTTPAPSTSSTTTTTTTEIPTTTVTTTTTTPPPPKRSPLANCPNEVCRMEATVRITGGVKWKPEYADINTEEFKNLEITVKRELDGAFRASGLAPWYKRVQIEGFNRGSVLVDYFVELEGIDRELSTADVVKVFHKSLLDSDPGDEPPLESDAPGHLPVNGALRFGRYTIDPRYTDFKVVNKKTGEGPPQPDPLIPQWGIAVIVIGLVSLLFVFLLGVTVLVNRHKNSKKKNAVSLTQEMLNEFNKSHMGGGVDNYGADDLYNMDDVWNDKQVDRTFDRRPTKRSQGSGKGSANYNIYDSWKTEWNGYYYNGNYYGDSGYAPSRRRSDYDTNF